MGIGKVGESSLTAKITIDGGLVFTSGFYQMEPKSSAGGAVLATTVALQNVPAGTLITSLTAGDVTYTLDRLYTDAGGAFQLWLPEGQAVTNAKALGQEYGGNVLAGETGELRDITRPEIAAFAPVSSAPLDGILAITFSLGNGR